MFRIILSVTVMFIVAPASAQFLPLPPANNTLNAPKATPHNKAQTQRRVVRRRVVPSAPAAAAAAPTPLQKTPILTTNAPSQENTAQAASAQDEPLIVRSDRLKMDAPLQAAPPQPVITPKRSDNVLNGAAPKTTPDVSALCGAVKSADVLMNEKRVVSADYIPEVDVNGRRVIGANLGGQASFRSYNDPVQIPIELDLIEYMNIDLAPRLQNAVGLKPTLSFINVHDNGRVMFNNQDITAQAQGVCG